jgi:hypothetical protein
MIGSTSGLVKRPALPPHGVRPSTRRRDSRCRSVPGSRANCRVYFSPFADDAIRLGSVRTGTFEQLQHLFIGRLVKVFVPGTDSIERFGRDEHLDAIDFTAQALDRGRWRDRQGHDDVLRMLLPHGGDRSQHREAGSDSVVDEDRRFPGQVRERSSAAIELASALEFSHQLGDDPLDVLAGRDAQANLLLVDRDEAVLGYYADRIFRVEGCTDLAREDDVQRNVQRSSDLVADQNATAW